MYLFNPECEMKTLVLGWERMSICGAHGTMRIRSGDGGFRPFGISVFSEKITRYPSSAIFSRPLRNMSSFSGAPSQLQNARLN